MWEGYYKPLKNYSIESMLLECPVGPLDAHFFLDTWSWGSKVAVGK